MEEWKEYMIGDICRIKHGFAFKGIHFVDEPQKYVCVTPGNFALKGGFKNDKPKYYNGPIPKDYVLHKDDLVVTMTDLSKNGDTLGYSALIPEDDNYIFLHNQRIGLIEDISQEIDKHFLYWVMRTYDYQRYIVGHCSGSTVKHTSPSGIGSYFFKCPDIKKQKNISSILDNIDGKIEVNRRINENLEQLAQALFKSWFVDFEPFKDGEFVESELGMIPKGWRVGTLNELIEIKYGKDHKKLADGNIPVYGSGGIMRKVEKSLYSGESVLIPRKGSLNNVLYVNEDFWTVDTMFYSIPTIKDVALFTYLFLSRKDLESLNAGSAVPSMTTEILNNMHVIIPQLEVLEKFNHVCFSIYSIIKHNEVESRRLAELRDTLLPRLMSGKLKVNEIENSL